MDVYLKNEKEKDIFQFPVNPFSITVNRSKKYETADVINIGEIDFTDSSKKIKELSLDTLFPKEYDAYCNYIDIPDPVKALSKLEKWMEQKEPVRLIITDFDYNGLVLITSIREEERPGEVGDKYIALDFRAWRELKIEALPPPKPSSSPAKAPAPKLQNNRPATKSKSKTYTVKKGDSLWKIAKNFYGNGAKWPTIYNNTQNKKVIGKNPNLIKPGQKLVIP